MERTSEELEKMLSEYQNVGKAPVVSEEEYNTMADKVNNLKPIIQQNTNITPIELNASREDEAAQSSNDVIQPVSMPAVLKQPELSQDEKEWQEAIKERNFQQMLGHFQKAGELMGAGFARVTPNTEGSKQTFDNASQALNDYKALREARDKQFKLNLDKAMNDPKSDISKSAREQARKYGLNLPDSVPYSMSEKIINETRLYKQYEDMVAARKESAKIANELREQNRIDRSKKDEATQQERDYRKLERFQSEFNKDKQVSEIRSGITSAETAEEVLNSGNPISKEAMGSLLPRLMGEKGVLTDKDAARFGGSRAIDDRIKQFAKQSISGTLTDENRKYMQEIINTMKSKRQAQLSNRMDELAAQGSKRMNISQKEAVDYLDPLGTVSKPNQAKAASLPPVTKAQLTKYAKDHNSTEDQAAAFLTSQGYNVEK